MSKNEFFICPADDASNASISQHPDLVQEQPANQVKCFFGRNMVRLNLYPVKEMLLEYFKKSKVGFYAFKKKGDKIFYFYSQNLAKKPKTALEKKIADLLVKAEQV